MADQKFASSSWPRRYLLGALGRLFRASTSVRVRLAGEPGLLEAARLGRPPSGLSQDLLEGLRDLDWEVCRREDEAMESQGVQILGLGEPGYPEALSGLPDPPVVLYLRGDPACLNHPCVAVVGSRLSTTYGQNVSRMLGEDLARLGVTVVSGLARGNDAQAHQGSLAVPGRAAAVMATGIDRIYPRENERIARSIVDKGGVLLTEAPPETKPAPRLFPVRNRIIAGLSWAVVVVEAAERSGSLITARLALEYGRDLFAVPHNITSRTGVGPNTLLQRGARVVQRAEDILEEMPPYLRTRLARPVSAEAGIPGDPALSAEAQALLRILRPDEPQGIDALASSSGFPASRILALLLELQMAGLCAERPGMRYARSKLR